MGSETVTDDVLRSVASIETQRREMETASGLPASCNEALRQLYRLLDRERDALQMHGTGTQRHSANIGTVSLEITRVKTLAGDIDPPPRSRDPRPGHAVSPRRAARAVSRNKGTPRSGSGGR
jgi:hypothetical protein